MYGGSGKEEKAEPPMMGDDAELYRKMWGRTMKKNGRKEEGKMK